MDCEARQYIYSIPARNDSDDDPGDIAYIYQPPCQHRKDNVRFTSVSLYGRPNHGAFGDISSMLRTALISKEHIFIIEEILNLMAIEDMDRYELVY